MDMFKNEFGDQLISQNAPARCAGLSKIYVAMTNTIEVLQRNKRLENFQMDHWKRRCSQQLAGKCKIELFIRQKKNSCT